MAADLDELFLNHELNETVLKAFETMGPSQANLLMDQVTREYFDKTSMVTQILGFCTRLYGSIFRGIAECTRKMSKTGGKAPAAQILSIMAEVQKILKWGNVVYEMSKIKESAAAFLQNANGKIRDKLDAHKASTPSSVHSQLNINVLREQTMQRWKQIVVETSNRAVATHVVGPVLSHGVNRVMSFVHGVIKQEYRAYKEEKYQNQFNSLKKDFDANKRKKRTATSRKQKELKAYHDELLKLMGKTRNAKLFASILRENVPMDMTCVQACTNVIHDCLRSMDIANDGKRFTGITIVVEGTDGSSHEYSSSSNPSVKITLRLDGNHFTTSGSANVQSSMNNCLFGELSREIPELKTVFNDGTAFRESLSNHIENDVYLQHVISQGWHQFSIGKGSFGGAIKEEHFVRKALRKRYLGNVEKDIRSILKNSQNLPHEVRVELMKYLEKVKDLATADSLEVTAIKDIQAKTKDLWKWLEERRDQKELKQSVSTILYRLKQMHSKGYRPSLLEFLNQARIGEESPLSTSAIHVADRPSSRDYRRLSRRSIRRSTGARNDPNIIAIVIHKHLHTNVDEAEQRFNTTAVGIHDDVIYVALNYVWDDEGCEKYGINKDQCTTISKILASKKLVSTRNEVVFLENKSPPETHTQCRAPHGEMQILSYWEKKGILQEAGTKTMGASKPVCHYCSMDLKKKNVTHEVFAKANMMPKNWYRNRQIRVRVQGTTSYREKRNKDWLDSAADNQRAM